MGVDWPPRVASSLPSPRPPGVILFEFNADDASACCIIRAIRSGSWLLLLVVEPPDRGVRGLDPWVRGVFEREDALLSQPLLPSLTVLSQFGPFFCFEGDRSLLISAAVMA